MPVALRSRGIEPIPPRLEPIISVVLFLSSPCHATDTILRRCAPCVVALAGQCGPCLCISVLAHLLQAVRRYASASPTAAFAGQKGSNVRLRISPYASTQLTFGCQGKYTVTLIPGDGKAEV
jgi:hypothetical protein